MPGPLPLPGRPSSACTQPQRTGSPGFCVFVPVKACDLEQVTVPLWASRPGHAVRGMTELTPLSPGLRGPTGQLRSVSWGQEQALALPSSAGHRLAKPWGFLRRAPCWGRTGGCCLHWSQRPVLGFGDLLTHLEQNDPPGCPAASRRESDCLRRGPLGLMFNWLPPHLGTLAPAAPSAGPAARRVQTEGAHHRPEEGPRAVRGVGTSASLPGTATPPPGPAQALLSTSLSVGLSGRPGQRCRALTAAPTLRKVPGWALLTQVWSQKRAQGS